MTCRHEGWGFNPQPRTLALLGKKTLRTYTAEAVVRATMFLLYTIQNMKLKVSMASVLPSPPTGGMEDCAPGFKISTNYMRLYVLLHKLLCFTLPPFIVLLNLLIFPSSFRYPSTNSCRPKSFLATTICFMPKMRPRCRNALLHGPHVIITTEHP